jgi:MoxR-like ATPase
MITNTDPRINDAFQVVDLVRTEVSERILVPHIDLTMAVGAVVMNHHVIDEGDPGTGKSELAKAIAEAVGGSFSRVQGTPDLMASDISGYERLNPATNELEFVKGPIFSNVTFADEINRATSKAQSGFLEPMQERQVTVGGKTYVLPDRSVVIATHNPDEDGEGVNPLPKAGLDRFLISLGMDPHSEEDMLAIDHIMEQNHIVKQVVSQGDLAKAEEAIRGLQMLPDVKRHAAQIVVALRQAAQTKGSLLEMSQSRLSGQRAFYGLKLMSKVAALTLGVDEEGAPVMRRSVSGYDVDQAAQYVLPHRIGLSWAGEKEAQVQGKSSRELKKELIADVVAGVPKVQ